MMMPKKDAEAIDRKRREQASKSDDSSSSSSSSDENNKKKKKKKNKNHHHHHHHNNKKDKKHRKDDSSSASDSEAELRRKFEQAEQEEREAERKAEVLDTDGEGDDEGEKFESELRKNKEVRRVNGKEVLTVAPGSDDLFVVSDDHLSDGEKDAIDHDFYAASVAAEHLESRRRRRLHKKADRRKHGDEEDRRAQEVLEKYARRELAELQRDRRIAESSSFAGSEAPSPSVDDKTGEALRLRLRDKGYYKRLSDAERFMLWAEIPVLQMLNDRAWKRLKADPAFKHSVRAQTLFQKQLNDLANRARSAIRPVDSTDMPRWEAAVQGVLAPPSGAMPFSWDEQRAERADLVCSFSGAPIAENSPIHVLSVAGARYVTPQFSYAAQLDSLAKFSDIYKHIGNSARARLGELTLPDNADMVDRLQCLFADAEWTAELRAVYAYGVRMCQAVVEKYGKR